MPAGKLSLYIEKGATWHHTLYWQIGEPPVAVDLTGYTARMKIRSPGPNGGVTQLIELTTENDRITLEDEGEVGRIDLHIEAVDTETIAGAAGVYDLEMVTGEDVTRLVQGDVTLSPESTRTP
jgi:hypothetical protein